MLFSEPALLSIETAPSVRSAGAAGAPDGSVRLCVSMRPRFQLSSMKRRTEVWSVIE